MLALFGCLSLVVGCASSDAYVTSPDGYYADEEAGYAEDEGGLQVSAAEGPRSTVIDFSDVSLESELHKPEGSYLRHRRVADARPAPPPNADETVPADKPDDTAPVVVDDRAPQRRLMIYRADYQVMVASVEDSVNKLIARAEALGGYLQRRADGAVTVRVPAERFFELTKELAGFGVIARESLEAQDVTKQFVDLQLRIETAERSRARLLELLSQATKMEDILRIESEVRRLTEEIETMKGGLRLLSDQIAFSTLTVQFLSNAPPPSPYVQRRGSRFKWVNAVGIERVLHDF